MEAARISRQKSRQKHKAETRVYKMDYRKKNLQRAKELDRASYLRRKEHILAQKRANYLVNGEHLRADINARNAANPTVHRQSARQWQRENKGRVNANCARRHAAKLHATPSWLTEEQQEQIVKFYVEAKRLEQADGIKRHVDHIYPLQGKTVCGLHVPWNLQILVGTVNMRKGNRIANR